MFAITSSIPIPFKNNPRDNTIKNLTGFKYVKYCKNTGISSMGDINPDSNTAGIINVITDKIACCCVLQIEDIKRPTPTIASNDINIETKNKNMFELTEDEMNKIRSLDAGKRFFNMTLEEQERNLGGWKPED